MRWLRRIGITLLTVVIVLLAASGLYLAWDDLAPVRVAVDVPGATVDAAGVPTHVEHWPALHPSGKAPLVLVPGFAESTYVFSRLGPRLAADRDVYAYDVRGYGFTAHVGPYTLASDTDQLAGLIGALHLTRPVVLGHSLGAAIALSLALRNPTALGGVVAANGDGTPYFGTDRSSPGGGGLRTALTLPPVGPAVVTAIVRHRGPVRSLVENQCGSGCPVDDAAIDRWRAPFLTPGGVSALLAIARQPLIGLTDDQERQVRVPVAIVFSSLDTSFDRGNAAAMADRVHTTLVTELPDARHLALLGEPDRFQAAVTPLLDRLG
ncbi:alpha/beta fold hydrolase [Actinomycetospora chiangmaiensis]|uniref:alpha/beta fold hydrolase n=1 Tax=Actinomycetospora chiangmaiensis TaxID=402650 RepID=UPI00035D7F33|nr:alpha/beta hydrolase [Actinomycetospora chiangmaiensis]